MRELALFIVPGALGMFCALVTLAVVKTCEAADRRRAMRRRVNELLAEAKKRNA